MKIAIVGTGYVGLVAGACFAEMGNKVTCVDIDESKVEKLSNGTLPIYEPGLEAIVSSNLEAGRLSFSSHLAVSLQGSEIVFIAVGTPPNENGSVDLSHVLAVAKSIGEVIDSAILVVNKSTTPVGTAEMVRTCISQGLDRRDKKVDFDVVSNPEFLREGNAVNDFLYPDRVVIGSGNHQSQRVMTELYAAFTKKNSNIQFVGIRDAEMIKYAANAMLATKISLMNEIALMCDELGVDVENVRVGVGSDSRIGPSFIYPGCGYGGSCFPKDVRAMIDMAQQAGLGETILDAVERRNEKQQRVLVDKIVTRFGNDLSGKGFAIWGLAFKPETKDIRGAPSIVIARALSELGARVLAFDPQAMDAASSALDGTNVEFFDDPYVATEGADALIVVTEWRQFKEPDFKRLRTQLTSATIFDGRNIYDPARCASYGLTYVGIGRNSDLF